MKRIAVIALLLVSLLCTAGGFWTFPRVETGVFNASYLDLDGSTMYGATVGTNALNPKTLLDAGSAGEMCVAFRCVGHEMTGTGTGYVFGYGAPSTDGLGAVWTTPGNVLKYWVGGKEASKTFTGGAANGDHSYVMNLNGTTRQITVYMDGDFAAPIIDATLSSPLTWAPAATDSLNIGRRHEAIYYKHGIDEVIVMNRFMTQSEITAYSNNIRSFGGVTGVVGYWRMEYELSNVVSDEGSGGNDLTLYNSAEITRYGN